MKYTRIDMTILENHGLKRKEKYDKQNIHGLINQEVRNLIE